MSNNESRQTPSQQNNIYAWYFALATQTGLRSAALGKPAASLGHFEAKHRKNWALRLARLNCGAYLVSRRLGGSCTDVCTSAASAGAVAAISRLERHGCASKAADHDSMTLAPEIGSWERRTVSLRSVVAVMCPCSRESRFS